MELERFKRGVATLRQAQFWPYYIVLICLVATFTFFPGVWDSDTVDQQHQIITGMYHDWHPPVFAAVWGLANKAWNALTGMAYTGSGVLYVLHSLMLWSGFALIIKVGLPYFRSFSGKAPWKFFALSGGMLLWGLMEMVPMSRFIFKDTAMLAAYILALGLMLNMPGRKKMRMLMSLACLLVLFYGTAVRHNSIFALIPLLVILFSKAFSSRRAMVIVPCSLLVWCIIAVGINYVNYTIIKAKKTYSIQEIFYGDIWRLNYKTKIFDLPPPVNGIDWSGLSEDVFFNFYDDKRVYVNSSMRFIERYYKGGVPYLNSDVQVSNDDIKLLFHSWLDKIKKHPAAYISTHKRIFVNMLREYTFFGIPGFWYFILAIVVVSIGLRKLIKKKTNTDPTPYLIALSGLFYVMPYFLFITDIQRRYLFWFIFASSISVAWIGAQFATKSHAQSME